MPRSRLKDTSKRGQKIRTVRTVGLSEEALPCDRKVWRKDETLRSRERRPDFEEAF